MAELRPPGLRGQAGGNHESLSVPAATAHDPFVVTDGEEGTRQSVGDGALGLGDKSSACPFAYTSQAAITFSGH